MADLRRSGIKPFDRISEKAVPEVIRMAVSLIFRFVGEEVWFVGGSALAGYYAEHRRSDDIDLFVRDERAYRGAVAAVRALGKHGFHFQSESTSPFFYRAVLESQGHSFTTEVVLDENLHRVGKTCPTLDGVWVADLSTLLMMKIACLVSRCSEKDLFDLDWLFMHVGNLSPRAMIEMGLHLDGGLSAATLLIGLRESNLRKEACQFILPNSGFTVDQVFRKISLLRKRLIDTFVSYEKSAPLSQEAKALSQAVRDMKKSGRLP